jgi:hypothetical protein
VIATRDPGALALPCPEIPPRTPFVSDNDFLIWVSVVESNGRLCSDAFAKLADWALHPPT